MSHSLRARVQAWTGRTDSCSQTGRVLPSPKSPPEVVLMDGKGLEKTTCIFPGCGCGPAELRACFLSVKCRAGHLDSPLLGD